jgi:hypothetical protein
MKALSRVRRALLLVLILATVALGGGLLMVPLTLRPLTLLDRLLLRLALADDGLGLRVTWWVWML